MNPKKTSFLLFCIIMDLIGCVSYTVPGLGEFGDIVWAPVSAFIFFRMFGGWKGAAGGIFNFVEEILPGTDFIPSFTLMWLWQNFRKTKKTSAAMQAN
jgi:hypothetical protein